MRISEFLKLNRSQYELDFIDIDIDSDIPHYLGLCEYAWAIDANRTLESFFALLLSYLKYDKIEDARHVFMHLIEPNETHLGLSKGKPRGRGVGPKDTEKIFENLLKSKALNTGVVEDLEDFRIFVEGVGRDKISDLTTNIIKKHLIEYTINQCRLWNIPLQDGIPSGFFWERTSKSWVNEFTTFPLINREKILLIPKRIVSYSMEYTPQKYMQHFVLNYLQEEHLRMNSSLVQVKRNKKGKIIRKYVTKKSIADILVDKSKDFLADFTSKHPEIFESFKLKTKSKIRKLENNEINSEVLPQIIDFLIKSLDELNPGNDDATKYHRLTVGILELLFYPNITSPNIEAEIHDGRKRIDITFDNSAETGFFWRLWNNNNIPAPFIIVECKNYNRDIKNPELDQIGGRFSPNRGQFGIILCRKIDKIDKFLKRCSDTYKDNRGLIIPLVDDDLIDMLMNFEEKGIEYSENILQERFRKIALN
ncbi:MAG: hypothetical protein PQJ61_09555 [Spirochaetales bacterium]|uniref:Uncharacterized protein n=1 Tax=Candidatus Thalassospirochaeta sargassi TaxID=3119039 RepID=A0AAJ1MKP2_9SPIO|nr:hypothetical protein [Spirochaetales bacterium]